MKKGLFLFAFTCLCGLISPSITAAPLIQQQQQTKPLNETQKIEWLIAFIAKQEGTFIRNGSEYTPAQAAEHLRMKWKKAGDKIATAQDFIKHLASSSSMSGKPYQIKFKNGQVLNVGILLQAELKRISQP